MMPAPDKRPWSPFKAASQYQLGLAAFEETRYAEAIEHLAEIPKRSLPGTLARFYLGQSHFRLGVSELRARRYKSASDHLTTARRINPESVGLSRYLTAAHVGQSRYDLAADEIESNRSATADVRIRIDTDIRLAYALVRDGQLERAVSTLESAIRVAPGRAELHQHLGLILAAVDEHEAGCAALARAAELAPLHADIQMHYALTLGASRRPVDAIAPLSICRKLRPHDAHVALLLALAIDAAGESIGVDPAVATAPPELDADLDALGDLLVGQPDFVEAFLRLPESAVDADLFAMLARTLEKALERRPDYADLHHHCSQVYARLGRTEDAISASQKALGINPRYVQALIQLGRLYVQTDRRDEAVERLREAIRAGGDYPDVHHLLGRLYREAGDHDAALTEYRRALALNDRYESARQAIHELATVS